MHDTVTFLQEGLGNLAAYLAAHVLLCLLPAFFIADDLSTLVPKESDTRFLGRKAPQFIAYPAAVLADSVLAVCSCAIVPLFAGIYKKGAGLGPAITFLFFAPVVDAARQGTPVIQAAAGRCCNNDEGNWGYSTRASLRTAEVCSHESTQDNE